MTRAEDQGSQVKVAVLGGGMGGLAAAWQLVHLDPGRYDITVFQRGWRLGGKGASGRNRAPGQGLRIEEHGLHILMGFYDHTFQILKTCYDELGPQPADSPQGGIGTWQEALSGADHLHVCDRYRDGHQEIWELYMPARCRDAPGAQSPGEPDVAGWMRNGLAFLYQSIRETGNEGGVPQRWLDWLGRALVQRETSSARLRAELLGEVTRASVRWALAQLFERLGDPEARDPAAIQRRRQVMTAYFVGANLLGVMNEGLWSRQDFLRHAERIDHLDYREWLHRNTGSIGEGWPELAWRSPLVEAVYHLTFSNHRGFGAGTALYDTLCTLLGYRNQLYYRMNGGMGDVVFAPLYLWLRRRGVKFRFFQRVRKLGLDQQRRIERITLERQVDLGGAEYDPLFPAGGRACWPSRPLTERLPEGERRRLERSGCDLENGAEPQGPLAHLRRGRDFDDVVLALPLGVLQREREVAGELAAAHLPFAEMIQGIRTTGTRAFQIWTDRDAASLGWQGRQGMLGTTYRPPFDSWADMSQVLPREGWDASVAGVHYFCGVDEGEDEQSAGKDQGAGSGVDRGQLPEPGRPPVDLEKAAPRPEERVRGEAMQWLSQALPGLLPGWSWDRTCAAEGQGPERFAAQYWRANSGPSERYVLASPGTLRFRLAPGDSGFPNLFLAGDWVKTDLNAGCVEAAAMAGVAAARALHDRDRPQVIPAPARLRAYVDRDSDWVMRAPVRAEDVTTAAFLLRADPEALSALCAQQIDGPTAGQVTAQPWPPRAGLVILICSQLPHVASGDLEHGTLGYFREHDVGFFVPAAVREGGRQGLGLLAPYLFVDSPIGLSAGREIYGFSKLLAHIEMPAVHPGRGFERPPGVTVTSDVLAPDRRVEQATVLEIVPAGKGARAGSTVSAPAAALSTRPALWRLWPLLGPALARWGRQGPGLGLPMVFLKQFRDAAVPAAACHQSLVQCGARAALAGAPRRLGGTFVVRLPHHAKPDVAGTLGLPHELETNLALQLEHDLYLPEGHQIWP